MVFPKLKNGGSVLLFGARRTIHRVVNAFEDSGFLLKDMLAWKKKSAYHRAQRVSVVFERRGLTTEAEQWKGWRLGNLAPMFEPIAWLTKPYCIGGTIADNVLEQGVGAMNTDAYQHHGVGATNVLEFAFAKDEKWIHEANRPSVHSDRVDDPGGTNGTRPIHGERHDGGGGPMPQSTVCRLRGRGSISQGGLPTTVR